MKLIYISTIMFVLCTQYIIAVNAGEKYNVTTIKCYGDALVKFRSEQNITEGEYNFVGCKQQDDKYWKCKCNEGKELLIQLYTKPKTVNTYDIKINYYIQPKQLEDDDPTTQTKGELENDINQRGKEFNNLHINQVPKKTFNELIPSDNFVPIVIGIIILVVASVMVLGYFGFKFIAKDDGSMDGYNSFKNINNKSKTNMTDEEILEYIKNNVK